MELASGGVHGGKRIGGSVVTLTSGFALVQHRGRRSSVTPGALIRLYWSCVMFFIEVMNHTALRSMTLEHISPVIIGAFKLFPHDIDIE